MSELIGDSVRVCPECGLDCSIIAMNDGCGLSRSAIPNDSFAATIDGKSEELDVAVERAAEILAAAKSPLIYGLARSTTSAHRAAVRLADRIGACLDIEGCSTSMHFPDLGVVSCTLGEVKNRADLIVLWGGRPDLSHPRLLSHFAIDPPGLFVPNGRRDRIVIVVGDKATAQAVRADESIIIQSNDDFAALWLLRALVQGRSVDPKLPPVAGVLLSQWQGLADRLRSCRFGVLFINATLSDVRAIEAAYGLATDLNVHCRFHVAPIHPAGNSIGGDQVCLWQTGYSPPIGLNTGFPRSFADEYSADRVLKAGEVDAVLLIEARLDSLSAAARKALHRVPTIALTSQITSLRISPMVAITTSACANPSGDVAFRFDGLALHLRQTSSPSFPDEFQILSRVEEILRRTAAPR